VKLVKAYELMLILDPSLDDDAQASVMEKAKGVITEGGGTVDDVDPWGKRQLAYEIDDQTDGIYAVVKFHADAATVAELDRVLHITDQVLRSMIVRLEHVA
jgi:small subunit ribosomal protein S6